MSEPVQNACCYRCTLRDKCPHPEKFFCNCMEVGTCNGQRPCNPCPEFQGTQREGQE